MKAFSLTELIFVIIIMGILSFIGLEFIPNETLNSDVQMLKSEILRKKSDAIGYEYYGKDDYVWIIVHSGSRNFGHKIAQEYMKLAAVANTDEKRYEKEFEEKNKWREYNPEKWKETKKEFVYRRVRARLNTKIEDHFGFKLNSELGKQYIKDMNLALKYSEENRKRMLNNAVKAIKEILNTDIEIKFEINTTHNHAEILSDGFVIHRKGATHADSGVYGIIPGDMKNGSFIVRGKGYEPSLNSSSHGAGRVLSRKEAKEQINFDDFLKEMKEAGVECNITESTVDESPSAYKNIFEVMKQQENMVNVTDRIIPLINVKG